MKKELIDSEIAYSGCFSDCSEDSDVLRFRDISLPDMYDHNFTYVKNHPDTDRISELVNHEISLRAAGNQSFCKILLSYPMEDMLPAMFTKEPEVGRLGFYTLYGKSYMDLKGNDDCSILQINNSKRAEDNIYYDLMLDKERLGEDFCRRRAINQNGVYLNHGGVDAYICYHDGKPVGTCELYLHKDVAKIENFTVLPCEQRKKYGTSILKHLITLAYENKAHTIYLVTDEEDTAKDMYRKFGFEKAGEMTEMMFFL